MNKSRKRIAVDSDGNEVSIIEITQIRIAQTYNKDSEEVEGFKRYLLDDEDLSDADRVLNPISENELEVLTTGKRLKLK